MRVPTATLSIEQSGRVPGFFNFQLRLALDSEDSFRTSCRNVSRKRESFSGLH